MKHPPVPGPEELALPLRDILRGLRQKAPLPKSLIEPALNLLPRDIRSSLKSIVEDVAGEKIGRLRVRTPDAASLQRASLALKGGPAAPADVASALAWGGAVFLAEAGLSTLLVSETVAVLCWHEALDASFESPARAAALVQGLDRHSFISPAPGIVSAAIPDSGMEPARLRQTMTALVVWLLAERSTGAAGLSGEHELLRIALWLCDSSKDEIAGAFRERERLGILLQQLAERI